MKTQTLVNLFGSQQAVGDLFGITKSAVSQWGDEVPELRVYQLRERVPNIDSQIAAMPKEVRAA